ncbi:probable proteasome inhibitor isoform X3 [Arachis stenosperma]|uniref:probable proteasome inhibitor isoform X3 n=1 Tax=Arachis stenosperma TaxID=217475 RepID=UPI0025AD7F4C|nr:probable proteasome inhibitor isoform X3 [Arachis stenosperma]
MVSDKTVLAVIRASRPTFRNQNDKIAFAVHSSFLASGYVLTATGSQALCDTALSNSSSEEVAVDHWNELNDEYAFVYANPERGSKKVLLKCLVMNEILLVDALSEGSSEPVHLDINVGEYAGEDGGSNYSQQFKNLDKLVKIIDGDILSKFDGSANASSSNKRSETTERQEIHETGTRFGDPAIPPNHPVGGGHNIGGSMLVGPNDPRFFGGIGGIGGEPGFPGGQLGVPPGARFDPYGPPGVPGFEPNRFTRNPRRPGYDAHPDLQHFRRDPDSDYI